MAPSFHFAYSRYPSPETDAQPRSSQSFFLSSMPTLQFLFFTQLDVGEFSLTVFYSIGADKKPYAPTQDQDCGRYPAASSGVSLSSDPFGEPAHDRERGRENPCPRPHTGGSSGRPVCGSCFRAGHVRQAPSPHLPRTNITCVRPSAPPMAQAARRKTGHQGKHLRHRRSSWPGKRGQPPEWPQRQDKTWAQSCHSRTHLSRHIQ